MCGVYTVQGDVHETPTGGKRALACALRYAPVTVVAPVAAEKQGGSGRPAGNGSGNKRTHAPHTPAAARQGLGPSLVQCRIAHLQTDEVWSVSCRVCS